MIRDEYSDEVGDLWDAFSKALKTSSRDWIKVKGRPQSDLAIYALRNQFNSEPSLANQRQLQAVQNQVSARNYPRMLVRYIYEPRAQSPIFGGIFGNLL